MNVINIINMPMPAGEKFWNMIPLGIMGSFCEGKDLIALSSTNKEAVKKMFQIWKKCFEESNLFFSITLYADQKVVHLQHFSRMFSIYYKQPSMSVFNINDYFDVDVRKYNFQSQIAYNRHVVRLFPDIKFDSNLYKDAWALITQNRIARLANPHVPGLVKDVFVCNIMSAIAHHHHQLFYLLEGIRTRLLTEEGCKEIVNFFENPRGIVKTHSPNFPDQEAVLKYNKIANFLLAYAVRCGNEEAVRDLLNKCTDINAPVVIPAALSYLPFSHLPPCHSEHEDEELFTYEKFNNEGLPHRYSLIQSFLTYAAFYGHLPIVQTLIENKANVNIFHEFEGRVLQFQGYKLVTPLICAVAQQHLPIVQALLDAKADTNLKTSTSLNHPKDLQCMPLGLAIRVGNIEIVQALLYAKADPNAPSVNKGASQRLLLKSSPLASAVTNNNPEMVQLLLAYRADVNLCDKNNFTPLALAAGAGNLPLMNVLLASKADVNQSHHRCSSGNFLPIPTALMIAARMHQLDAIQMLICAKADPNFVVNEEDTALQVVIRNDVRSSYKHSKFRLLKDENEYDEYTSYFRGVEAQGDIGETVSRLLELRADPNECSRKRNKYTILMRAAALRELGAVHALLEGGAHCNLVDPSGQTALIHAIRSTGKDKVVQVKGIVMDLLKYGADIHIADKKGFTALSLSQSKKMNKRAFEEVAEILKKAIIRGIVDGADAPSSCRKQKRQIALTQEDAVEEDWMSDIENNAFLPLHAKKQKAAAEEDMVPVGPWPQVQGANQRVAFAIALAVSNAVLQPRST